MSAFVFSVSRDLNEYIKYAVSNVFFTLISHFMALENLLILM